MALQVQRQQMTMGMGAMGADPQKAFDAERNALEIVRACLLPTDVTCLHLQCCSMADPEGSINTAAGLQA